MCERFYPPPMCVQKIELRKMVQAELVKCLMHPKAYGPLWLSHLRLATLMKEARRCAQCGRLFSNSRGKKKHVCSETDPSLVYLSKPPYKVCIICAQELAFASRADLATHLSSHSRDTRFQFGLAGATARSPQ